MSLSAKKVPEKNGSLPLAFLAAGVALLSAAVGSPAAPATQAAPLPLYFEATHAVDPGAAQFIARTHSGLFKISPGSADVTLRAPTPLDAWNEAPGRHGERRTLHWEFLGANREAPTRGDGELPGRVNYLLGSEPARWRLGVSTFTSVRVDSLYPGVDLIYYGNRSQLEHDFVVNPGANPSAISFRVTGADDIRVDAKGDLLMRLGQETLVQKKPVVYQIAGTDRIPVEAEFRITDEGRVGFAVGLYDTNRPLVIDPILAYSTFLGGMGADNPRAITMDPDGNIYVAGDTLSGQIDSPDIAYDLYEGGRENGSGDGFVAKFDPTGESLLYLTFIGGTGDESATGIATDREGNLFVTGVTDSTNFPIASVTISNKIAGKGDIYLDLYPYDAFVMKLNPSGSQMLYSTYLGGEASDIAMSIAVDQADCAYITGSTTSTNFPAINSIQYTKPGKTITNQVFVTKIASNGLSFEYSTIFGGTNVDRGNSIAVDLLGRAYVAGYTTSSNFPVTPLAFQTNHPATALTNRDVFVAVIETNGSALLACTFIGGGGDDNGTRIRLGRDGSIYVAGSKSGNGFPATPSALSPAIFRTENAGVEWTAADQGLVNNQVYGLVIDPVNPAKLYAGTGRGVAISEDFGALWHSTFDLNGPFCTFAFDPLEPSTIYAGSAGVFVSTNSGSYWTNIGKGLTFSGTVVQSFAASGLPQVRKLVISPLAPTNIYAGVQGGVFRSEDGTKNWKKLTKGLSNTDVRDLVIDPIDAAVLYAGTSNGVFRTTNAGSDWERYQEGFSNRLYLTQGATNRSVTYSTNVVVTSLAFDSAIPATLYAGTVDGLIYKLPPGSSNWVFASQDLPDFPVKTLATDPASPSVLYAGVRTSIYKSIDAGFTWFAVTNGLADTYISRIVVDPVVPNRVFAASIGQSPSSGFDAFIAKLSPDLSLLEVSFILGGSGTDQASDFDFDAEDNIYVVGSTTSYDFPIIDPIGYPRSVYSGLNDAFVTSIGAGFSKILFSSFLGSTGNDRATGVVVGRGGRLFVTGQTSSTDFPIVDSSDNILHGTTDGFLSRLDAAGPPVDLTIATLPPGLPIYLDGISNATPLTISVPSGSFHQVVARSVYDGDVSRMAWSSWSDGGDLGHSVRVTNSTVLVAEFSPQYFLSVQATNTSVTDTNLAATSFTTGKVDPASGWYDAGTEVLLRAVPPDQNDFAGWMGSGPGSYSGTSNPVAIVINAPITEFADFSGPITNRAKVVVYGNGSVSPNYDGDKLTVGKTYTMTAQPGSGQVFAGWKVNTFVSTRLSDPKLTFWMQNGAVLEAYFAPSPFGPVQGTYTGLFYDTNHVTPLTSGYFSGEINSVGKLSAKINVRGVSYSLTGNLLPDGSYSNAVVGASISTSVAARLQLDFVERVLTGEVISSFGRVALFASLNVFSNGFPCPQQGKYTVILPGAATSVTQPGGDGYGTVKIDQNGKISFSGALGDGSKVTQSSYLSRYGEWPFYTPFRNGAGSIIGWLTVTNGSIGGLVNWTKLGLPVTNSYPGGFIIESEAVGSSFLKTNGQPVLPLGTNGLGALIFANAGLTNALFNEVKVDEKGKYTLTGTNEASFSLNTSSGLFEGKFRAPGDKTNTTYKGAIIQNQNRGSGYFLRSQQAGRASLDPVP
jgi:photosystem II stability/assembly factor-like uncharacterized protein